MKKTCLAILLIISLLWTAGCIQKALPEATVKELILATRDLSFPTVESLVSASVQEDMDLEEFWQGEENEMFQRRL